MYLPPASTLTVPFKLFLAESALLLPEIDLEFTFDDPYGDILAHLRENSTTDQHRVEHLGANRVRYLRDEGCFSGYDAYVTELALMEYLVSIHPFFPVLNRENLLRQVLTRTTSLLLLTSILAVVVSYGDVTIARALGFEDPNQAEHVLHNRAKLLFQTHAERDNITMLQSALLLSLCKGAKANSSNAREWSGVAVSLGQSMRLHRS
jgi:transcription factor-like protein